MEAKYLCIVSGMKMSQIRHIFINIPMWVDVKGNNISGRRFILKFIWMSLLTHMWVMSENVSCMWN